MIFLNREDAGRKLALLLKERIKEPKNFLILAIPRGGVPVAGEVSRELGMPLSVVVVRKLGIPWNEEAAFGSIDPNGNVYLDEETVNYLGLGKGTIHEVKEREYAELKRREEIFVPEGYPNMQGKRVIVIDDGIATGYTAIAAGQFARSKGAIEVWLAVPVCPSNIGNKVKSTFDKVFCFHKAETPSFAVGMFYQDFHQLTDDEVLDLLKNSGNGTGDLT